MVKSTHTRHIVNFAAATCCFAETALGNLRRCHIRLRACGENPHRRAPRTLRRGRDDPASVLGEDALSTGESNVILALACSPVPRAASMLAVIMGQPSTRAGRMHRRDRRDPGSIPSCCDRIGSDRIGSDRIGSDRIGSDRTTRIPHVIISVAMRRVELALGG
jgi:hypothetical protein